MRKHNIFMRLTWYKAALLIACSVFGQLANAELPVANTPVNQSDYEPLHQGRIQVSATLFNAPCNLSLDKTWRLTGCGAGNDYREMKLFDATANTPASMRFYDVQRDVFSVRYPLSLLNGDNPIHLPILMNDRHTLRLEVSYE
ncbi:fimbrial protein [Providencia stuartii]|uniref:Fimbrial protein n=2 Tax=Morganellaceae TaxID=1903414 RepID=A0A1S1HSU3_PROST|nr:MULTISPECIES: fimbrial protein [Providencia]ELR5041641.1 fimbrial protein [Providencia stuartii]ELR5083217.1 fimbrial protein [Providencia stuartii]ELR5111628.1 fimbrial protein [Providencia stuartii]ELR5299182.1 fimbrial protein [Providencia stuartii]OHT25077.1 fimbrial protein [Providencia stuartii]